MLDWSVPPFRLRTIWRWHHVTFDAVDLFFIVLTNGNGSDADEFTTALGWNGLLQTNIEMEASDSHLSTGTGTERLLKDANKRWGGTSSSSPWEGKKIWT